MGKALARSTSAAKAWLGELLEAKLVRRRRTGRANDWEIARPDRGDRYVSVPDFADGRLWRLPPHAFRVLVGLAYYADKKLRRCFPRLETIAQLLGRSRRSVSLALRTLRDEGLVRSYATGRASVYELSWSQPGAHPGAVVQTPGPQRAESAIAPLLDRALRVALRTYTPDRPNRPFIRFPHLEWCVNAVRACIQRREAHRSPESAHTIDSLVREGVPHSRAMAAAAEYTTDQVYAAIEVAHARAPRSKRAGYILDLLERGRV